MRGGNEEAEETQPDGVFAESEKETEGNGSDSDGAGKALAAEAQGILSRESQAAILSSIVQLYLPTIHIV